MQRLIVVVDPRNHIQGLAKRPQREVLPILRLRRARGRGRHAQFLEKRRGPGTRDHWQEAETGGSLSPQLPGDQHPAVVKGAPMCWSGAPGGAGWLPVAELRRAWDGIV